MHAAMLIPIFTVFLQGVEKPDIYTSCSTIHQASHLRREIDQSADSPC